MTVFAAGILAAALASPPTLPIGEPVEVRFPDYRTIVRDFRTSPPAWNEGLVNVGYGAAKGDPDRKDGWLRKHWIWLDAVDRSADSQSHGFLEHRGIFYDVSGYNEYQETIFFRDSGTLALFSKHGGIARTATGELLLHRAFSTDENKRRYGRGDVYLMDHLDPRWAALVGYDWLTSPLLGDGISQDNIGMTIPQGLTYGQRADEMFRSHVETTGILPRFRKSGGSIRAYLEEDFFPRAVREGWVGEKGVDPERIREDRVMAAYYRFQVLANLYQFSRHYVANKLVAARQSRPYDVHGNQGGFVIGFDPYQVLLGDFVDSIWFESRGFSSRDLFEKNGANAWGPFRFEMGEAMSAGRKPLLVMSREAGRGPALQAHAYAEASAGGGALFLGAHEVGTGSRSKKWLDDFFGFRDQNRALFEIRGRSRHAQVAVVYSLPTFLRDHAVPVFDRPAMNDLGAVALALEEGHVSYETIILGMEEIREDPFLSQDLGAYRAIVLPSVTALSQAQVERLLAFGKEGGTLVVLGELGVQNARGRTIQTPDREALRSGEFVVRPLGDRSFRSSRSRDSEKLKELRARIAEKVREVVEQPLLGSGLPDRIWIKLWTHEEGLLSAHFVNYDFDFAEQKFRSVKAARVSLRLPPWVSAEEISWRVPGKPVRQLQFTGQAGSVSFEIPALDVYGVAVIGKKGAADVANSLRRGDRYLFRARHAGKALPKLFSRAQAIESTRSEATASAYAASAQSLLEQVAARRESDYLAHVDRIAKPKGAVLALDFGGSSPHGPWKPLKADARYAPSRGYGWLASRDESGPTPEETEYLAASKSKYDPNAISRGKAGTWPHASPVPLALRGNLFSGRRQRLRIDVPEGTYRVQVVNTNPSSGGRRNFFVSGATWTGGESVLLDTAMGRGEWDARSFVAVAKPGGLELEFGASTGWGIAGLILWEAESAEVNRVSHPGALRSWRVSPRHPNPQWVPLQEIASPLHGKPEPAGLSGWTRVGAAEVGFPVVDLGTARQAAPGDVVYAATVLDREEAGRVQFEFGSTSSAEVWLNGKKVADLPNVKGIQAREAQVELELAKGRNVLVLALERFWERHWLFYGSLLESSSGALP